MLDDLHGVVHTDPGPGWALRFWSLYSTQVLALFGAFFSRFLLLFWITDASSSVVSLAIAGQAMLWPRILLSPLGGVLADRYSRRALMIAADLISALCMAVLTVLLLIERLEPWHSYVAMAVFSATRAFHTPAVLASLGMLVPRRMVPRVAGLTQAAQCIALLAAAPLGVLSIKFLSLAQAWWLAVAASLAACIPLLIYSIPQTVKPFASHTLGLWTDFREGVQWVWRGRELRYLYALMGVQVMVILPAFTLLSRLVAEDFNGSAAELELFTWVACAGLGLGSLVMAFVTLPKLVRWAVWGVAVSCFALAISTLMPVSTLTLVLMCFGLAALGCLIGTASLLARLQTTIPNQLQGRTLAMLNIVMAIGGPLGLALGYAMGGAANLRWPLVLTATAGGLAALALARGALSATRAGVIAGDQPQ